MKKVDNYKFITQGSISGISGDVFIKNLKRYESTGLTPQQIKDMQFCLKEKCREVANLRNELQELKKRNEPMEIKEIHIDEYYCPACGAENLCNQGIPEDKFCPECGQRLLRED